MIEFFQLFWDALIEGLVLFIFFVAVFGFAFTASWLSAKEWWEGRD